MRVTNGIPLGWPLLLPVGTVNHDETLQAVLKRDKDLLTKVNARSKTPTELVRCAFSSWILLC
jgi:hypothetical protein